MPFFSPKKYLTLPIIVGAGILSAGLFMMNTAGASGPAVSPDAAPVVDLPSVQVVRATPATDGYKITAPGRLRARQVTDVVGEIAGKVVEISDQFVLGGRLAKGDMLFRIDPTDFAANQRAAKARLASAQARLAVAKANFRRRKALEDTPAVSVAAVEGAEADLYAAQAAVDEATALLSQASENLARTTVTAPFDALVVTENVALDTYVTPGQVLATVLDSSVGELVAGLQPKDARVLAPLLQSGAIVKARALPNPGSVGAGLLEGRLDRFAPQVDTDARTALVVAVFKDAFALQNMGLIFADDFMTLEISIEAPKGAFRLPLGTVRKDQFIWSVEAGKLVRRAVAVLARTDSYVLVTSDHALDKNDIMITSMNAEIDGMQVAVLPAVAGGR